MEVDVATTDCERGKVKLDKIKMKQYNKRKEIPILANNYTHPRLTRTDPPRATGPTGPREERKKKKERKKK